MKDQRGSTVLTVVILTPVMLVMFMFVVFVGRVASTDGDVRAAARDAARAASVRDSPAAARVDAQAVGTATLADRNVSCASLTITTAVTSTAVRVDVACIVGVDDLTGFAVPGKRTITVTATEPIDVLRSDPR